MPFFQLPLFDLFKTRRSRPRSKPEQQRPATARPAPGDDAFLKAIWIEIRQEYFPEREDLDLYLVYWSRRKQIRTLASCNIRSKRVSVAKELNHENHHKWLHPLLYHEMCHAYLEWNISTTNGKRSWHGKDFRALERRHPGIKHLDQWIKDGGWLSAVRSHRARSAHQRRRTQQRP